MSDVTELLATAGIDINLLEDEASRGDDDAMFLLRSANQVAEGAELEVRFSVDLAAYRASR